MTLLTGIFVKSLRCQPYFRKFELFIENAITLYNTG